MSEKISREQVEAEIESLEFRRVEGTTTTVATLRTKSGPVFVGTSACISAEDFDEAVGVAVARQKAVEDLWQALGIAKAFVRGGCPVIGLAVTE